MSPAVEWLFVSGLSPLFGAGAASVLVGLVVVLLKQRYWWSKAEIADPMGWLYGAAAIGVESALKIHSVSIEHGEIWWIASWTAVLTSGFLLLITMAVRGLTTSAWPFEIPRRFKVVAFCVTLATLAIGLRVHWAVGGVK